MKLTRQPSTYSYFEFLDACRQPGCPLCRLGHASAQRHLTHLIYDGVNDVPAREQLRDSYGYCHEHAWMLPASGESAPLGIAIIHRDVLNTLRRRLQEAEFTRERGAGLRALFSGPKQEPDVDPTTTRYLPALAPCPACVQRAEAEQLSLTSVLEALDKNDEAMQEALAASEGLCLVHLRLALGQARKQETFEALVALTSAQLDDLIHDLDEFVRKNDHRFRDEKISAREADGWRRALQRVSGNKKG